MMQSLPSRAWSASSLAEAMALVQERAKNQGSMPLTASDMQREYEAREIGWHAVTQRSVRQPIVVEYR